MADSHFAYIWKYSINPDRKAEFLENYRSNGSWAKLFSRDANYHGTVLLQDADDENVYLTIDYWTSRSARDRFRETFAAEFDALDKRCEADTVDETFVGDFVIHKSDVN